MVARRNAVGMANRVYTLWWGYYDLALVLDSFKEVIHWLKTELEDLCFKYLNAEKYEVVRSQVQDKAAERKEYEDEVVKVLRKQMTDAGLGKNDTLLVSGRTKGLYSIYSK